MAAHEFLITSAGAKELLFAQLLDIGRVTDRPLFKLDVRGPYVPDIGLNGDFCTVGVLINGLIAVENGTGDNWIVFGYIPFAQLKQGWLKPIQHFKAIFNSRTRDGHMLPDDRVRW
ncbi:MAG: hypothetical protein Q7R60_00190 [bacterium]|nr:hypothetical protein [bacterium]